MQRCVLSARCRKPIPCAQPLTDSPLLARRRCCRLPLSSSQPLTHRTSVMEKNGIEQLLRAEDEAAAIVQKARESTNQRAVHREAGAVAATVRRTDQRRRTWTTGDWHTTPTSPAHSTPLCPRRHLGSSAAVRWDRGDDATVVIATVQSVPPSIHRAAVRLTSTHDFPHLPRR